jgi:hypothetical protein
MTTPNFSRRRIMASITRLWKKLDYTNEHEVYVRRTWPSATGYAPVVFTGTEAACIAHRAKNEKNPKLAVRPTGRIIPA